jgi:IclR family transcriptional regulator, acetate operon repressor
LPKEVFDSYSQNIGLKRFTPYTQCDPEELWKELSLAHNEAVVMDKEEFAEGFCCLAIPIWSENGEIAALGMAVPTQRFANSQQELVSTLKQLHTSLTNGEGMKWGGEVISGGVKG